MHAGAFLARDGAEGASPPAHDAAGVSPRLEVGIDYVLLNLFVGVGWHLDVFGIEADGSFFHNQQIGCSGVYQRRLTDECELMVVAHEGQLVQGDLTCIEVEAEVLFVGQTKDEGAAGEGAVGVLDGGEFAVVGDVNAMSSVEAECRAVVGEVVEGDIDDAPKESGVVVAAVDVGIGGWGAVVFILIASSVLVYKSAIEIEHEAGRLYVLHGPTRANGNGGRGIVVLEHELYVGHAGGVEAGQVQVLERMAVHEHGDHVDDVSCVEACQIDVGKFLQS